MNSEMEKIAGDTTMTENSKLTESQMIALRYIRDTLEHVKLLAIREGLIIADDIQDAIDAVMT